MLRMKAKPRSTLGQACSSQFLVARQARMPGDGPQSDAGFLPMRVHQHEAAVLALEAHQVLDAVARLVGAAQVSHRFQQERAVHHPQPAIAGRADLERGQALLDLARLVNVADRGVQQRLHAGVRDFNAVVGQGRLSPKPLGSCAAAIWPARDQPIDRPRFGHERRRRRAFVRHEVESRLPESAIPSGQRLLPCQRWRRSRSG